MCSMSECSPEQFDNELEVATKEQTKTDAKKKIGTCVGYMTYI